MLNSNQSKYEPTYKIHDIVFYILHHTINLLLLRDRIRFNFIFIFEIIILNVLENNI